VGKLLSEAPKDVRLFCQLVAPFPRLTCRGFRLRPLYLDPGLGVLQCKLEAFSELVRVGEVQGAGVLVLTQL
jgi:hypothetical protein